MTAREVANKLMQHPDACVCGYRFHYNADVNKCVIFNGQNWYISCE